MLAFAVLLAAASPAPADPALTLEARARIAPVHEAYVAVERKQAGLPPAKTDSERLERLLELDQSAREVAAHLDFNDLPPEQRGPAFRAAWVEIGAHDLADQQALKAMIPPEGWFLKSRYGADGAKAAFLIVQHAVNDPVLMRTTLAKMKPLVAKGEANGPAYALLYDRVSLEFDHKPQRYGSQVFCKEGKRVIPDLEDPAHVDERRKAIGMKQTEAEYLKMMSDYPCPK